jgi:hypothetical protein
MTFARMTPPYVARGRDAVAIARLWLLALAVLFVAEGCASTGAKWVTLRSTPRNPLSDALGLLAKQGPKPTPRTIQLLRRHNLEGKQGDKGALLAELNEINRQEPDRENLYALSELAYVGAKRAEVAMKRDQALELYGSSVLYAYEYLFSQAYPVVSNEYDPQFRRACDLYNAALEGTLRIIQSQGPLKPGMSRLIKTSNHQCQLDVQLMSNGWHEADFDHFEFVSDFEVHGLTNHYHNFGLGVPLVAVRRHHEDADPAEQYYPPALSFAVTAFLRLESDLVSDDAETAYRPTAAAAGGPLPKKLRLVLELHDPLDRSVIKAAGVDVPLETDLSTPLAHNLSQPALDDTRLSTRGLLHPEEVKQVSGLYMLEPFQADKIPVVMVHGLWSSPVTWMEMFNDLRSDPKIREHYQFWFYLYPSGEPFWLSAGAMRSDLERMRVALDPAKQSPALDQTVLVGHSMGGLISKLQTVDSGDRFWATMSDKPFNDLQADPDIREELAETYFFDPNPSIRRIITIGTPHRGSDFSNDVTKWFGSKLINVPAKMLHGRHQLATRNPGYFRPHAPLEITNSIDSLSPKSPILPVLLEAPQGPWVRHHNIVGEAPHEGITSTVSAWLAGTGDGVVSLASAQLEGVVSQITVPADHQHVHRHPKSILEVRRILLQHVAELQGVPSGQGVEFASGSEAEPAPSRVESTASVPTTPTR